MKNTKWQNLKQKHQLLLYARFTANYSILHMHQILQCEILGLTTNLQSSSWHFTVYNILSF